MGGEIDFERWRANPPLQVKEVGSRLSQGKLIVTLSIDETATVQDSQHGREVVIEIAPAGTPVAAAPVAEPSPTDDRQNADRRRRPIVLGAAFGREFGAIILGGAIIRR